MTNDFKADSLIRLRAARENSALIESAENFLLKSTEAGYSYNFHWLDRPIIQYPQDIMATQELIYEVKPDLIVETGIAHGGSLCLSASMLALLDYEDCVKNGTTLDPRNPKRLVLGVDIDIRAHNHRAIKNHFLTDRIRMIEGSSIDKTTINKVREFSQDYKKVLVLLDSNHTHEHVLSELRAYGSMVSPGSYCVVFDTLIENMPINMYPNRPWAPGDNPLTAVRTYLSENNDFMVDHDVDARLMISVAKGGFLKKIR